MNGTGRIGRGVLHGERAGDGLDGGACAAIRTAKHARVVGETNTPFGRPAAELAWEPIAALVEVGGARVCTRALSLPQGLQDFAAAYTGLSIQRDDMWTGYCYPFSVNQCGDELWVIKTNEKKNKKA